MAITIPATGSGTQNPPVATEVIGGEHYQFFKLVDGNVGSAAAVGTSANPFNVFQPGIQSIVGSVGMTQLGAPWSMVGSVTMAGSTLIQSSLTVFQGAAPWSIVGSVVTAANSPFLVEGDVAHGSFDLSLSYPIKIGGFAVTSAFPSFVNSGARVQATFDRVGRIVNQPMAPITLRLNKHNDFTGPLSGTVVWSCGQPGGRIVVTDFKIVAGSATAGIATLFFARSGAPINFTVGSGTSIFRGEMAPSATAKPGALMSYSYPEVGDPNDAVRISLTTSMQVYVSIGGYETP